VELALLLKTRASEVLTQGLELGPVLSTELLRESVLRLNGAGPTSGLLVLRAGRQRVGNLTPLECLVEAAEGRVCSGCCLGSLLAEAAGLRCNATAFAAALPPAPDFSAGCTAAY
jgi:hypothetical protein